MRSLVPQNSAAKYLQRTPPKYTLPYRLGYVCIVKQARRGILHCHSTIITAPPRPSFAPVFGGVCPPVPWDCPREPNGHSQPTPAPCDSPLPATVSRLATLPDSAQILLCYVQRWDLRHLRLRGFHIGSQTLAAAGSRPRGQSNESFEWPQPRSARYQAGDCTRCPINWFGGDLDTKHWRRRRQIPTRSLVWGRARRADLRHDASPDGAQSTKTEETRVNSNVIT